MNWNPTWICPANDLGDPAAVFGTSFVFEKKITHANLTITAMGVYEARLNGRRVGQFVMAPGWTSYHKRLQYQKYDITDLLTNDKNEIEVTRFPHIFESVRQSVFAFSPPRCGS